LGNQETSGRLTVILKLPAYDPAGGGRGGVPREEKEPFEARGGRSAPTVGGDQKVGFAADNAEKK